MSTEVGSLNASLTLDLSDFRAGMSEAASLAAQLGAQLQSVFSGDVGFSRMTAEVLEMIAQVSNLSAAMEDFKASLAQVTGADMFAQMRTVTAALPGEIASVTSALNAADLAAIQLGITLQEVAAAAAAAASSSQGLAGVGTSSMNFAEPLAQLQQMSAAMADLIAQLDRLNTLDTSTGEIVGTGDSLPALYNVLTTAQQINAEFNAIAAAINECVGATTEWASVVRQVSTMLGTVSDSMRQANAAARGAGTAVKGAGSGASNFASQTGRASKNLQTSKGYAVSIKDILGGIAISQAFYKLLNVMEDLVSASIEFSENMQDASVAFSFLFKDADESADAFLNSLKEIALYSPLDTTDLTSASRKLMAMGFSANAAVPAMQILTDTAAVFSNSAADMSDQIDHITLALGQMLASGKVSAQELRQLYNAGLPIYDLLADGLGITKEMAKNIGKYNIDASSAVFAVLTQLQDRYKGAAEALSHTFTGSISRIKEGLQQLISFAWASPFVQITAAVDKLANRIVALAKITQAYGMGGLFQALFPESSWVTLRNLIGGLIQLGKALKQVGQIFLTAFGGGLQVLAQVGSYVVPIVGNLANVLMTVARAALAASPALRLLLSVIAALVIGSVIAKVVVFLAKAIWLLTGAKAAAQMIAKLISAIAAMGAVNKAVIITVLAIAAAFLAVAAASQKARAAIAAFFGSMRDAVNGFAEKLGLGFDPADIAMPEFKMPDTKKYSAGVEDLTGDMDDLTDATDKAGKSAKKNLQSFDEVYTIDDDANSGASDALSGISDAMKDLGDLSYDDLFDWTGDWAADWGTLSAGLGDLNGAATDAFGNIGTALSDFWNALTGGDYPAGLAALEALSDALLIMGKLKWAGALKVVEGIAEIVLAIKDIAANGLNINNALDVIHGLSNVALGIGIFVGNIKLVGWSLAIQGFTEIIRELADNWDAIRQGDWSGVSAVTLIIGGLKLLGGLVLALGTFSALKKTTKTAEAAKSITDTAADVEAASTSTGTLTSKLGSLVKNLALGLVIIAEVAAAALLVVGAVILLGKELEQVGIAWEPVIANAGTVAIAMGIGVALLAVIGTVTALLGSVGTALIVNVALGTAILAEMGIATALFLVEIWAIGELLNQIGEAWQPVLDNGETIKTAILLGTALLVAIGVVTAALGLATVATAGALPLAIALGTAILIELGIAAAAFTAEIIVVGLLLQEVGNAWQPVLDNGETIATAIEVGTGLLIAIGVVTAALGVATVASAGLLPLAIGLGTAILVELAAAFILLVESMVAVADELSNQLAPALADLNGKLPGLTDDMNDFVAFMVDLADAVASYSASMGSLTWDSIVNSFRKFFTGSPIANLADDIEDIGNDASDLNDKLRVAVPELENAVNLLTDYGALMATMKLLTEENGTVELASGMFTNLKDVGKNLVTGLTAGIEDEAPNAVKQSTKLGKDVVTGVHDGADKNVSIVYTWVTTFATDFLKKLNTAFGISGNYATTTKPAGAALVQGILEGMKAASGALATGLTNNISKPTTTWAAANLTTTTLYSYGQNTMTGFSNGMYSMRYVVLNTVDSVFKAVKNKIADIFDIHSPSGVTTGFGENLDTGMINGIQNNAKQLTSTAATLANAVTDSLTPGDIETPTIDLSNVTNTSLTSLQSWSTTFVEILTNAFAQITALFDQLNMQLATSMANIDSISPTLSASAGSIAAADQLGATSTTPTGTSAAEQIIAILNDDTLDRMSAKTSAAIYEYLAPLFATLTAAVQDQVIAYIGTLIADDAGLKELYRKLKVVQVSEGRRS